MQMWRATAPAARATLVQQAPPSPLRPLLSGTAPLAGPSMPTLEPTPAALRKPPPSPMSLPLLMASPQTTLLHRTVRSHTAAMFQLQSQLQKPTDNDLLHSPATVYM